MLSPRSAALVLLLLAGCGPNIKSKEKVQQAILQRLQTRSGLDLASLEVTTTSVSFDKNLAYATVAFHPKGESNINSGMTMKYTLEDRDGKWVVVGVGGMSGHGMQGHATGSGALPPGHPPIDSSNPQALPAGTGNSGSAQ